MARIGIPALILAVAAATGTAAQSIQLDVPDRGGRRESTQPLRMYGGVSNRGLLQEAIDDAVAKALRAQPGADRLVRYRVRDISGESGGIRGGSIIRVVIEVEGDDNFYLEPRPGTSPAPVQPRAVEPPGTSRPPSSRPQPSSTGAIRQSVSSTLRLSDEAVERGEGVVMTFTVRNTSDQPLMIPARKDYYYDFEVWQGNRLVWRWSQGKDLSQQRVLLRLDPGQAVNYSEAWDLRGLNGARIPAGRYVVKGYLKTTAEDLRVESTLPLSVTGR
jgi:hypothetical protein